MPVLESPPLLLLQPPPTPPSPMLKQPSSVAVPPLPPPKPKLSVVPQPSPATSAEQEPQLPLGELVVLMVAIVAAMHPKRDCREDSDDVKTVTTTAVIWSVQLGTMTTWMTKMMSHGS